MARQVNARTPVILSAMALLVSVGSAALSFFSFNETRKFNEIGIRPHIETIGAVFVPPESKISILNRGNGPAYLQTVKYKHAGVEVSGTELERRYAEAQVAFNTANKTSFACTFKVGDLWKGQLLQKEQRLPMFTTSGDCPRDYRDKFFASVQSFVTYRSSSEREYSLQFGVAPMGTTGDRLFPPQ